MSNFISKGGAVIEHYEKGEKEKKQTVRRNKEDKTGCEAPTKTETSRLTRNKNADYERKRKERTRVTSPKGRVEGRPPKLSDEGKKKYPQKSGENTIDGEGKGAPATSKDHYTERRSQSENRRGERTAIIQSNESKKTKIHQIGLGEGGNRRNKKLDRNF